MRIAVFGLTITSSWGNGHATTFRALLKALSRRGHSILFVEKDVEWYRNHRDLAQPDFCTVRLYSDWKAEEASLLAAARNADAIVIGSYFPDAIVATKALLATVTCPVLFYDIDTPITLAALRKDGTTPYLDPALIPHYDAYLSFSSGPALQQLEQRFGARRAIGFFCSVDPGLYHRVPQRPEFAADLSYLGTHASDRQPRLMQLLNHPAGQLPERRFLVAGSLYPAGTEWQPNVERNEHVPPADHPAFYSSCRFTLNLTRADMIELGYSPSVRLFEASACGTAILSDSWAGLSDFLTPGEEILLPGSAEDVVSILRGMSDEERRRIGERARERILAEHTSDHRARQFEAIVASISSAQSPRPVAQANADTTPEMQPAALRS